MGKNSRQEFAALLEVDANRERAQSLLVRDKLAQQLGRPEAAELTHAAEAALEAIERPVREKKD
jgi:hypothetical protein